MTQERRCHDIDSAKGIGILIVILAHMFPAGHGIRIAVYSFHMPLFFIISGILGQYTGCMNRPATEILLRRIKGLMVPYFFFEFLSIFGYLLIGSSFSVKGILHGLWNSILLNCTAGATWFLPTLFGAEVLFLLAYKYLGRKVGCVTTLVLGMAALLIPVERHLLRVVWRVLIAQLFYCIGFFYHTVREKARDHCLLITLIWGLAGALNGQVDMSYLEFGMVPLYLLSSMGGSILLIELCRKFLDRKFSILHFYGRNSLIILGTHLTIFYAFIGRWHTAPVPDSAAGWYHFMLICLLEVPLCVVLNRCFPNLVGRKKGRTERRGVSV